jgi:hypothetical protein
VTGVAAPPGAFTLTQPEREARLLPELVELTAHHRAQSPPYARLLAALGHGPGTRYRHVAQLPWLPVRLFKEHVLSSIPEDEVFTELSSSGTTGPVSRVFLDRDAAARQQRALARTLQPVLGAQRLPMLLVDAASTIAGRGKRSARAAGLLGMMVYGRAHTFLLDRSGAVDLPALRAFLAAYGDRPFLVFGFTFLVWEHLYPAARAAGLDLGNGILLHTGGWKKLADRAVDGTRFRTGLGELGLRRIHNYYGMAEQLGTVFLEGPTTHDLYCPDFADVIVREPGTWGPVPVGTPGVIEVLSTLPRSYPGHALLTEDLGVVHGIDDGDWPGKRFSVLGRLPRAEVRGCSDTLGEPA